MRPGHQPTPGSAAARAYHTARRALHGATPASLLDVWRSRLAPPHRCDSPLVLVAAAAAAAGEVGLADDGAAVLARCHEACARRDGTVSARFAPNVAPEQLEGQITSLLAEPVPTYAR